MRKPLSAAAATLCALVLAPTESLAQSKAYLRVLPEAALVSVEHTKQVTTGDGSSSSTSSSVTPEGGLNIYMGYLAAAGEAWHIGAEFRGTISLRPTARGDTPGEGSGTHAVWPGPWQLANRVGLGGNIVVGRTLTRRSRGFLFAGFARWTSDLRSAGADPASEELVDDQEKIGRWPLNAGIGVTLPFERPLDIRLRYFRSTTSWNANHTFGQQSLDFDYTFVVNGLALSLGLGTR